MSCCYDERRIKPCAVWCGDMASLNGGSNRITMNRVGSVRGCCAVRYNALTF